MRIFKSLVVMSFLIFSVPVLAATTPEKIRAAQDGVVAIVKENGLGSGFVIGENLILTNVHVAIMSGTKIYTKDGTKGFEFERVFVDDRLDLAFLKLKDWEGFKKDNPNLKILKLSKVNPQKVEDVYSIGHPWGLIYSISRGIVSNDERRIDENSPRWFIQTDAKIYEGNSGGPLLNEKGEVVGVNTIMLARTGGSFGFSIPSVLINKVLTDFKKYGQARWISLGVTYNPADLAIVSMYVNSSGEKAGLKIGDKILKVNGKRVRDADQMRIQFSLQDSDTPITLTVERDGKQKDISFKASYIPSAAFPVQVPPEAGNNGK